MAVGQRPGSDRPRRRADGPELLERQPPCNLEAERAVLGSVLLAIDRPSLLEAVRKEPAFAMAMLRGIADRLRHMNALMS